ncbi:secretin N-terminal domain-containing protein, partial [Achromobacter denitrificans]
LTRVFPLKYENAANLVPVLRPMVPPNNPINAYPGNNTLVVTDYADNLERIASVIARIDVPSSIDTDVVPVRSGIASDIAVLASQLLDTQSSDPTQRIAVVADPRSNSVLVRAGSPARTRLARDLIMKLDAQQTRAGNLHVVYMRNAQATRIAEVLGGLL